MKDISIIIVDPQVGFCKPSGTLAKAYGESELAEIAKALGKINLALESCARSHLVVSEYAQKQFSDSPILSNLCVPQINDDCKLVDELAGFDSHSITVKTEPSAVTVESFMSEIEKDLEQGIKHFAVLGFLLEHCVKAAAIELYSLIKNQAAVYVASDMTASRCEKYKNGVVDSTIGALNESGIKYQTWQSILA